MRARRPRRAGSDRDDWLQLTLRTAARRAEWDRANGPAGALVPYQAAPPHARTGGYDDFDLGPAYPGYPQAPPPRRTHSSAGYRDPPYRDPPPYAPPRGREYDMYDDLGLKPRGADPYGRSAPASSQPRRGGLEADLFANPFGAFGGGQDMFDLGLGGGGANAAPQQGMSDPFALFQGFLGNAGGGNGGGRGGGGLSMSPTGGADDAFSRMFDQLSTGGNGHGSPSGATRGAFATHRVTRKHTNRDGDVTVSRQERTMAMMDAGPRGQVMVESSFRMVGRQPSGGSSLGGGGGGTRSGSPASMFESPALPAHSAPPRHRASTLGYGGLDRGAIASAPHTAYSGIEPRYGGSSGLPAIESGRAPPPRMLTAPPGMDLAPYGGAGPMSRW